ncbi:hypothetical protein PLESTB_000665300 [Pleodorina starrii]|uniref:Uncharacterized protein n=1 Tax=Pleodorina starrii TaxID=330485 RepID=A0A9W6BJV9_9CHLO|nr:hypothetical protein PLESTM_001936700 [Pleodorina starrii]GLC52761.1 hypothetical protein PLESTB_000665300 [Pleodorina starrii]GLC65894.1 hypothetical protein PLESTF_000355300 [Pleodorina starrii]
MTTEAEIKLIPVHNNVPPRKSPPRLVVPCSEPVVGDDYLFSPGVETPGHRLAGKGFQDGAPGPKQQQLQQQQQQQLVADSPRPPPGCLPCLKPR